MVILYTYAVLLEIIFIGFAVLFTHGILSAACHRIILYLKNSFKNMFQGDINIMKAEWVNPFISNAIDVFEQMANITLERSNLSLKEDPTPSNDISIIVGITGFIEGQVIYSLKVHTAERIAQALAPKSSIIIDSDFIESSIAEVANIITGRTTIQLSGKDKVLHITPPTIVIGKDFSISFVKLKTISVNLSSRFGTIEVNIAIRDGVDNG